MQILRLAGALKIAITQKFNISYLYVYMYLENTQHNPISLFICPAGLVVRLWVRSLTSVPPWTSGTFSMGFPLVSSLPPTPTPSCSHPPSQTVATLAQTIHSHLHLHETVINQAIFVCTSSVNSLVLQSTTY